METSPVIFLFPLATLNVEWLLFSSVKIKSVKTMGSTNNMRDMSKRPTSAEANRKLSGGAAPTRFLAHRRILAFAYAPLRRRRFPLASRAVASFKKKNLLRCRSAASHPIYKVRRRRSSTIHGASGHLCIYQASIYNAKILYNWFRQHKSNKLVYQSSLEIF